MYPYDLRIYCQSWQLFHKPPHKRDGQTPRLLKYNNGTSGTKPTLTIRPISAILPNLGSRRRAKGGQLGSIPRGYDRASEVQYQQKEPNKRYV